MNSKFQNQQGFPDEWRLFPYQTLKKYQVRAIREIQGHQRVMMHAPTGFGKTIVTLVALLPYIKKEGKQLVIFTRTKTQIFEAIFRELSLLANKRVYGFLTAIPIITKADLCLLVENGRKFHPDICNGCNLYQKTKNIPEEEIPVILEQIPLWKGQGMPLSSLKRALGDFGCPYFITRRGSLHADVIITTHAYLLNRKLRDYFLEHVLGGSTRNKVALVDEAHNFGPHVEAELSKHVVERARKIISLKMFDELLELMTKRSGLVERIDSNELILEEYLTTSRELTHQQILTLQHVLKFLQSRGDAWISQHETLYQVTPFVDEIFQFLTQFDKTVLISGTFLPLKLHATLYGTNSYHLVEIPSEYRQQCIAMLKHPSFTSKYDKRNPRSIHAQVSLIQQLHGLNPHHTLVISPSYEYMEQLIRHGLKPDVIEPKKGNIDLSELATLLNESRMIAAVMGGKLLEGVEIVNPQTKRSLLTLIIITGLAYPVPDHIHDYLMKEYSRRHGPKLAKELLIHLPMFRMLQQALGRGIRAPHDYSAAVILDYRATLLKHLPSGIIFRKIDPLVKHVREFLVKHEQFNISHEIKKQTEGDQD